MMNQVNTRESQNNHSDHIPSSVPTNDLIIMRSLVQSNQTNMIHPKQIYTWIQTMKEMSDQVWNGHLL